MSAITPIPDNSKLTAFYDNNKDFDILHYDLNDINNLDQLNWQGIADKDEVLNTLKAYQRLYRLDPDNLVADTLYDDGITSAAEVLSMTKSAFIGKYASKFGVDGQQTAENTYQRASAIKTASAHLMANVHSFAASPHSRNLAVTNIDQSLPTYFQKLSSYQQMFGSLDYCECSECQSIYGPPAYFVDLMRIINKAITVPNTTRSNADDNIPNGLRLNDRRPDLFSLELTCSNTNDLVPYLQIVNDVLEKTLVTYSAFADGEVTSGLANSYYPFNLPFNLPLEQMRSYLGHFKVQLYEVYQAMANKDDLTKEAAREFLLLSVNELSNLMPPSQANLPQVLSKNFGLSISTGNLQGLDHLQTFIDQTKVSRDQLLDLFTQGLSAKEIFDVSGVYTPSTFGTTLTLTQSGNRVTGTYDYHGGTLEGVIIGNVLKGHWAEGSGEAPTDAGNFEFEFDYSGQRFTGKWAHGYNVNWDVEAWNGTRNASSKFTGGIIPHTFFINQSLSSSAYLSIKKNTQSATPYDAIANLDLNTLDRVNRFIRLAAKLEWKYADLNWVMTAHKINQLNDDTAIKSLAITQKLNKDLDLAPVEASSLWFDIKTIGAGDGINSNAPFDTIFNNPDILRKLPDATPYHPVTTASTATFINPLYTEETLDWVVDESTYNKEVSAGTITAIPKAKKQRANIIMGGIPASQDDTTAIAQAIFGKIATIKLTVSNMSAIYRHAKLANVLNIQVSTYLVLLKLLGYENSNKIIASFTAQQVAYLNKARLWIVKSGMNPLELDYFINGTTSTYVNKGYETSNIPAFLVSIQPLLKDTAITPTSFSYQDISKSVSLEIYQYLLKNDYIDAVGMVNSKFETTPPDWNNSGFNLSDAQQSYINDRINSQHTEQIDKFSSSLTTFFGAKPNLIQHLLPITSTILNQPDFLSRFLLTSLFNAPVDDVSKDNGKTLDLGMLIQVFGTHNITLDASTVQLKVLVKATLWELLDTTTQATYYASINQDGTVHFKQLIATSKDAKIPDFVEQFIDWTARYLKPVASQNLKPVETDLLAQHPEVFAINDFKTLDLTNANAIYKFRELTDAFDDTNDVLVSYFNAVNASPPKDGMDLLNKVTNWNEDQCKYLCTQFFGAPGKCTSIANICSLKVVFDMSISTGTDVYTLQKIYDEKDTALTSSNLPDFTHLSNQLLQSIRAQVTTEEWPAVFSNIDKKIEEARRSAMEEIAIWTLGKQYTDITNSRNLYEFLLIDVDKSGCAQISVLKEALNASQLYLQRCRLNLERNVTISTDNIPTVYWEWLMNYRVWEANRKIFLYPENYIEPTLRKSKTDLFKELENTLQQGAITDENVEKAYKTYLDKLTDLAKLKYVDSYHCTVHSVEKGAIDTLFLFARTRKAPYEYYYITREPGNVWSQWNKIGITINSEYVSAVYAFHKLFVFWVEISQSQENQSGNSCTRKNVIYKSSIKYSFYDFNGNWVQPQTLVADHLINYNAASNPDDRYAPYSGNMFNMSDPYWNKVIVNETSPTNYVPHQPPSEKHADKLSLWYGPFADQESQGPQNASPLSGSPSREEDAFAELVSTAVNNQNQLGWGKVRGHMPLNEVKTLDLELEDSYLLNADEFLYYQKTEITDSSAPTFESAVGHGTNELIIQATDSPLYNNFTDGMRVTPNVAQPASVKATADSFTYEPYITTSDSSNAFDALKSNAVGFLEADGTVKKVAVQATTSIIQVSTQTTEVQARIIRDKLFQLYYGDPVLFGNIDPVNGAVMSVKNQPGWFILNSGTESFLVNNDKFNKISDALKVDQPFGFVNELSFVGPLIDTNQSKLYFSSLASPQVNLINRTSKNATTAIVDLSVVRPASVQIIATALQTTEEIATEIKRIMLASGPTSFTYSNPDGGSQGMVTETSFVGNGITKAQSKLFYQTLSSDAVGIIQVNGKVNASVAKAIPTNLLATSLVTSNENAVYVKSVLIKALSDTNTTFSVDDNIYGLQFETTRLTTSAVYDLSKRLFSGGIEELLQLNTQQAPKDIILDFARLEASSQIKAPDVAYGDQVDFEGAYGLYFWELFFHGPMLVAQLLNQNQQYREAEKWYQYIFNPTLPPVVVSENSFETNDINKDEASLIYQSLVYAKLVDDSGAVTEVGDKASITAIIAVTQLDELRAKEVQNVLQSNYVVTPTSRYWQFKPFRNHTLQTLKEQLTNSAEIQTYNDDPFDPHAIARLRIGAYEKTVVMHYINNLLDWGDYEFTQYTWESITTATMLYAYAYDLLGPKPVDLGSCDKAFPASFMDILGHYKGSKNGIPQFLIDLENVAAAPGATPPVINPAGHPFNDLDALFCVPENDRFVDYWNRVQDRLYKIRHCLNIDGQAVPLPLFQPPIDPMALVKAAASGNSVLAVQSQLMANVPAYRFRSMIAHTRQFVSSMIQIGNQLLSVLEKDDAEQLALMHSTHQITLLNMTSAVKKDQIDQLQDELNALQQSLSSATYRQQHYSTLIANGVDNLENAALILQAESIVPQTVAIGINGVSIAGYLAPNIFGFSDGGMKFGDAINAGAQISNGVSGIMNQSAGILTTLSQYARRANDWQLQEQLAQYDINQLNEQIEASKIKIQIAQQELAIHNKTIDQTNEEDEFLKSKFNNKDLYQWMIGRLSTIYFQTYKVALDMALATQSAYNFELDRDDALINYNYWDSLHKGLLAGESLMLSVNQLEKAYIDHNTRRLELEKTISLRELDPEAFIKFKWGHNGGTQGQFDFSLSEMLFDRDFPGHYARKIKSVSISIPAVVGPYQNINATLVQTQNWTAIKPDLSAVKRMVYESAQQHSGTEPPQPDNSILRYNWVPSQHIALSKGTDDRGLFVLNFEDERYLPFEGTGAVSRWTLSMPPANNHINYNSISDVIVRIQYTALDGGQHFSDEVTNLYKTELGNEKQFNNLYAHSFDLSQNFAASWNQLMQSAPKSGKQSIQFAPGNIVLPNIKNAQISNVLLQLNVSGNAGVSDGGNSFISLNIGTNFTDKAIAIQDNFGELSDFTALNSDPFVDQWLLEFTIANCPQAILTDDQSQLDPNKLLGASLVILYSATPF